jgi:hypothetical protein
MAHYFLPFFRDIPSYEDPARYSFAHGGKDATPYPVDRQTYDKTTAMLAEAVRKSHISPYDKDKALKRITAFEVNSQIVRCDTAVGSSAEVAFFKQAP